MTEPWPIHTVVYDLDDTLYLERDYVFSGFAAVDVWLRKERGVTDFLARAKRRFLQGNRGRIFNEVLEELHGEEAPPSLVSELLAVYRGHQPVLKLLSDAEDALVWSGTRFNLGLITDGYREVQERKITALSLEERIPCRMVTDALGREFWKPHVEPYQHVMRHFGGEAAGFVYIGDNPRKDFIGARKLGWRTIRIRRESGEHRDFEPTAEQQAERDIDSLEELKTILIPCRD